MATSCSLVFIIVIFSAGNILLSKGLKFAHKKYVIVLTADFDAGPIGVITVEESDSKISYSIPGGSKLLKIKSDGGQLNLRKKMDDKNTATWNNTEITVQAKKDGKQTTAIVVVVILPRNFGDQFVHQISMQKVSSLKAHFIKSKGITPRTLLRLFRLATSEITRKIAMAEIKLEIKIEKIKKKITKVIVAKFKGIDVIVRAYLHLKELFSDKMMEEMEQESECRKANDVSNCPLNSRLFRYRTYDGTCNNLQRPILGAANTAFKRLLPAKYFDADGINDPIGYPNQPNAPLLPSPHKVSRDFINDEVAAMDSSRRLTHAVMQFGQFIDHDLDLAVEIEADDSNNCGRVPCDGSSSDFTCPCYPILPAAGAACIRVTRSAAVCQKHGRLKTREQINVLTAFIDASQVYGSSKNDAHELRQKDPEDRGLLKSQSVKGRELLPVNRNISAEPLNLCENLGSCLLAGDVRVNEQQSLASFHTLFLREHNRIARELKKINPHWNGETVYQETRKIVGAVMQKITYDEFLPLIIGPNFLPRYTGYNKSADPGISNVFATAAFRFGHSLIRPAFDILDKGFNAIGAPIPLRFMFFNNSFILKDGVDPLLRGLIGNFSERVDRVLSSGLTQHLFERDNHNGSNLAALNIQRHRDHGLPGYNSYRKFCGLKDAKSFIDTRKEIKNRASRNLLSQLYYDNPDLAEVWVAGLAETPVRGSSVGPTFRCLIKEQFQRTRDADRFFYKRPGVFRLDQSAEIEKSSLSRVYCDNVDIVSIQRKAFVAETAKNKRITCKRIPGINLCKWKEHRLFGASVCFNGDLVSRRGRCECACRRQCPNGKKWSGARCDVLNGVGSSSRPWHATFFSKGKIICSGALVSRYRVLTTISCLKLLRKLRRTTRVRVGKLRRVRIATRRAKIIRRLNLAFVPLIIRSRVKRKLCPIRIYTGNYPTITRPTILTVGAQNRRYLRLFQVKIARRQHCKKLLKSFKEFNIFNNICTLPTDLPCQRKKVEPAIGSPLVQQFRGRKYVVGLLTRTIKTPAAPGRFGIYQKLSW